MTPYGITDLCHHSGNGLPPIWHQAITWTNDDLPVLSTRPLWNKLQQNSNQNSKAILQVNVHMQGCQPPKYFFRIFDNFSVSLTLFLIRLKTVILATSYLLWWDPLAPSGNSSGFFRYYRNRKWGRARVTTTCGREKNTCRSIATITRN